MSVSSIVYINRAGGRYRSLYPGGSLSRSVIEITNKGGNCGRTQDLSLPHKNADTLIRPEQGTCNISTIFFIFSLNQVIHLRGVAGIQVIDMCLKVHLRLGSGLPAVADRIFDSAYAKYGVYPSVPVRSAGF